MHFTDEVAQWLTDHPGHHTPAAIARALGTDTTATAQTLLHLTNKGRINRVKNPSIRNGPGSSVYGMPPD